MNITLTKKNEDFIGLYPFITEKKNDTIENCKKEIVL